MVSCPTFTKNLEWYLSLGDRIYKCDPCKFETKYSQNLEAHFKSLKHIANTDNPSKHTTIVHEEIESFNAPNGHAEEESYENEGNFDSRFLSKPLLKIGTAKYHLLEWDGEI